MDEGIITFQAKKKEKETNIWRKLLLGLQVVERDNDSATCIYN